MKSTPSQHEEIFRQLQRHHFAKQLPTARINTLAEFLGNLDKVSESGDGWSARCPCRGHSDFRPSMSINIIDGKFIPCCHRGCDFEDIVQSAGMMVSEMFESAPSTRSAVLPPRRIKDLAPKELKPVTRCWDGFQEHFQNQANAQLLEQLAQQLLVSVESLRSIGVGWCRQQSCWTFPERNGEKVICGFLRRFAHGSKYGLKGGQRGLTLPSGWDQSDQPLHICEGASDVAAAVDSGMRAIGRPGLKSGFDDLAVLLKEESAEIVVVADNDSEGAGRTGAEKLAQRLSNALQKPIKVMAPPKKYKDLRECLTEKTI